MSRRGLEILAVILSFLIVIVLFAGFDNLPRKLRADISAEQQQLPQVQKQFQSVRDEVTQMRSAKRASAFSARPGSMSGTYNMLGMSLPASAMGPAMNPPVKKSTSGRNSCKMRREAA